MLSCYKSVKRGDGEIGMYSYNNQVKNSGKYIKGRPECPSQYINAVFVGDRSGSMYSMGSVPQEGAVQFMNKYKELAKKYEDVVHIIVTIYTFDDEVEIPFSGNALWLVSSEQMYTEKVYSSMIPRGSTKLFDTAILAIKKQQKELDEYTHYIKTQCKEIRNLEPTYTSSFTLLTDGDDNCSMNTSQDLCKAIKKHEEAYNTCCFFAAANQDAMYSGSSYGFTQENSLQIGNDIEQARAAFTSCTNAAMRSATQERSGYSVAEREASGDINDYQIVYSDNENDNDCFSYDYDGCNIVAERC